MYTKPRQASLEVNRFKFLSIVHDDGLGNLHLLINQCEAIAREESSSPKRLTGHLADMSLASLLLLAWHHRLLLK
jgi:hypothetical protein